MTTVQFDWAGRATNVLHPDGASSQTEYWPTGEPKKKSGAREYPVAYTYDYAGRMQTMTTWTNAATVQGALEPYAPTIARMVQQKRFGAWAASRLRTLLESKQKSPTSD